MQTLFLVCGIPMSGKTSVAYEIANQNDAVVLSSQAIREELFGMDTSRGNDKEVFRVLKERLETLLACGWSVVVDSSNPLPTVRRPYAILARKKGCIAVCVYCHKHYAYATTANMMIKRYPDHLIKIAHEHFVPPERFEGWDEIIIRDGNQYSLQIEGQIPVERRQPPRQPPERRQRVCQQPEPKQPVNHQSGGRQPGSRRYRADMRRKQEEREL